jgi:Ca2+-binding RTX toxin-like protein
MEIFAGGRGDDTIVIESFLPSTGGLSAYGRDGNDTVTSNRGDNALSGGGGNDRLVAMFGKATVEGGAGDDFLRNFKGTDVVLRGGAGDDTFDSVEGLRTDVHGGDGFDTVDCRAFSFNSPDVTFDDVQNDRISIIEGGTDFSNVHSDVEKALGPFGMDTVNSG